VKSSEQKQPRRDSQLSDVVAIVLLAASLRMAIQPSETLFASAALFVTVLMALSMRRRNHSNPQLAKAARIAWDFGPVAIMLLFGSAVLSNFGRYMTQADFGMFYATAMQLRTSPETLYDVAAQNSALAQVTGGLQNHYLSFPYPAFVAALFVPFTFLSFRQAYFCMLACNLGLFAFVLRLHWKHFLKRRDHRLAFVLAAAVLLPLHVNVVLGQISFIALLLFTLIAIDLAENRTTRAGLWTGLLAYKLVFMPVPVLLLVRRRAWGALMAVGLVTGSLLALCLALVGTQGLIANLRIMTMMTDPALIPRMQSLKALSYALGAPAWTFWIMALGSLAALLLADARGQRQPWIMAAAILVVLMASPYLQIYDTGLVLVALSLVISARDRVTPAQRTSLILIVFVISFIGVAGLVANHAWPAIPIALLAAFCYSIRMSLSKVPECERTSTAAEPDVTAERARDVE
jgi:hypothetical protein